MTTHTIPVPDRLQRPTCACGWTPPLPWPVTWERFDADAAQHLDQFIDCPAHGTHTRNADGRCPMCRWTGRTTNHATTQREEGTA